MLPVVNMDVLTTQNYLLDLTEQSKILPYNAGYRWDDDQLVGVAGQDGRFLDVAATLAELTDERSPKFPRAAASIWS